VLNKLMGSVCGHGVHGSSMTEGLKGMVHELDLDVMEVGQLVTRTSGARPGGGLGAGGLGVGRGGGLRLGYLNSEPLGRTGRLRPWRGQLRCTPARRCHTTRLGG
jgi:hypothetical protein